VTDQPSQQPPDDTRGDVPAQLAPDAPAEVGSSAAAKPSAPAPESWAPAPAPAPAFGTTEPGPTPYEGSSSGGGLQSVFPPDRPEYAVGAAFAGGLILALILKRLAD
jgi:hypothetical protein